MPLALAHESFLKSAVFQIADEVAVAPRTALTTLCGSTAASPCTTGVSIRGSVGRWWVVCWAWLETDRLVGVEVAGDSLDGNGDTALLYFHG